MTREEREAVYVNTVAIAKKGSYLSPKGKTVTITDEDKMIEGTKFYGKKAIVNYDSLK